MSKELKFGETSIPGMYQITMRENYGINWVDSRVPDLYRTMFAGIANTLKFYQSKDRPRVGLTMKDDKGNFKMGAILVFKKPEEGSEEDTGNWYLQMTFDQNDMTDLDESIDNHSDIFVKCAASEAEHFCYGRFRSVEVMYNMFNAAIDELVKFLDKNASETEEVEVTLPGIFTASVAVENGVKVMSIVPGEVIKQIIKNDSAL